MSLLIVEEKPQGKKEPRPLLKRASPLPFPAPRIFKALKDTPKSASSSLSKLLHLPDNFFATRSIPNK
jgi:hypothetical protein